MCPTLDRYVQKIRWTSHVVHIQWRCSISVPVTSLPTDLCYVDQTSDGEPKSVTQMRTTSYAYKLVLWTFLELSKRVELANKNTMGKPKRNPCLTKRRRPPVRTGQLYNDRIPVFHIGGWDHKCWGVVVACICLLSATNNKCSIPVK